MLDITPRDELGKLRAEQCILRTDSLQDVPTLLQRPDDLLE